MSYTVLTDKDVLIRKPHTCIWCLRRFQKGIGMRYQSGICDGDFYSCYICDTCDQITKLSRNDMEDGGWPAGYVAEQLSYVHGPKTPEDLLYEIKLERDKQQCLNLEKIKKEQLQ